MNSLAQIVIAVLTGAALIAAGAVFKKPLEIATIRLVTLAGESVATFVLGPAHLWRFFESQYRTHARLRLPGLKEATFIHRPRVSDVYVSLAVEDALADKARETKAGSISKQLVREFTLGSILRHSRLTTILGEPGAGKTTTLQQIICHLMADKRSVRRNTTGRPLPLYVPLSRLKFDGRSLVDELFDPAAGLVPAEMASRPAWHYLRRLLEDGRCLLLFDGLDEVADATRMTLAGRAVSLWTIVYPKCPCIVTSRVASFRQDLTPDFTVYVLRRLTGAGVSSLVTRWFEAVYLEALAANKESAPDVSSTEAARAMAARDASELNTLFRSDPHLGELAGNPLLLSMMCLTKYVLGLLPTRRTELFSRCVDLLLKQWDESEHLLQFQDMPSAERRLDFLVNLARTLNERGVRDLPRGECLTLADQFLKGLHSNVSAELFLTFLVERSGLVVERGVLVNGFTHKAFQEYFLARHIDSLQGLPGDFIENALAGRDSEVLVFLCGMHQHAKTIALALEERWSRGRDRRACFLHARAILEMREPPSGSRERVTSALEEVFDSTTVSAELETSQRLLRLLGVNKVVTRSFAEFTIFEEIGRGGQAVVFRGRHPASNQDLAVKVFTRQLEPDASAAWLRIYNTIAGIHNEHLMPVAFAGIDGGSRYLATQLSAVGTAADLIARISAALNSDEEYRLGESTPRTLWAGDANHALEIQLALLGVNRGKLSLHAAWVQWCVQNTVGLCMGLSLVHAQTAMLHRDIKPENLFVHNGRLCLADFDVAASAVEEVRRRPRPAIKGVERFITDSIDKTIDRSVDRLLDSRFGGTLGYAAPETLRYGAATPCSEVYSLGRCLHEMLCIHRAARQGAEGVVRGLTLGVKWRDVEDRHVSSGLRRVVEKACAVIESKRYRNPGEFAAALRALTGRASV